MAAPRRARPSPRATNCWRSRPPRSPTSSRPRPPARCCASSRRKGSTLPIGALLAVIGAGGRAGGGGRDVRRRLRRSGTGGRGSRREAEAPAPRDAGRRRRPAALPGTRRRRRRAGAAAARFRCRPEQLDVHPAGAGRRSPRTMALDLPGHGGSSKDVGAGDVAALSRGGGRLPGRARSGTGASGRPFAWAARSRRCWPARRPDLVRDADADRAGRARAGDQRRLHRRLRARVAPQGCRGGAATAGARPGAGQPHDGRGRAALQTPRRRDRGAGHDRACLVRRRAADAGPGGGDRRACGAGAGDLGPRRPDHSGGARRAAGAGRAGAYPGRRRPSAAHGEGRRGEPADPRGSSSCSDGPLFPQTREIAHSRAAARSATHAPATGAALQPPAVPRPGTAGQGASPRRRNTPRSTRTRRYSTARCHRARPVPAPALPPAHTSP